MPLSSEDEEEDMGVTSSEDEGEGKSPLAASPASRGKNLAGGPSQGLYMYIYHLLYLRFLS